MFKKMARLPQSVLEEMGNKPSEAHLAFIADNIEEHNALQLSSARLDRSSMPTICFGFVTDMYNETYWKRDVDQWKNVFEDSAFLEVKFKPVSSNERVLDDKDAIKQTKKTVQLLSKDLPVDAPIRLIIIGPASGNFLLEVIKYMLQELQTTCPKKGKIFRFIVDRETAEDYLDLFKDLCLKGTCDSIQYYNSRLYYPFGNYNNDQDWQ